MQNILGIVDKEGQLVVKYNYNAWGDHSVKDGNNKVNTSDTFIGNINPMRYKGYYYDKESKMYYCNSRYYVPQWCRWLNADHASFLEIENINGMNLFSYCANNPVMGLDPSGNIALFVGLLIFIGITTIIGAAYGGISAGMSDGDVLEGIGKGALNGLIISGGISLGIGGFVVGGTTVLGSVMATYGLSVTANMLEVAITQGKKVIMMEMGFGLLHRI